jgi:uncharacterized coiled-coil DUF342 family protein
MPSDDFVARLHRYDQVGPKTIITESADEIERLREQLRLANIDNFNTTAEVERMRTELEMWHDGNIMAESHRDELVKNADEFAKTLTELRHRVETLTAERDEARREVCAMSFDDQRRTAEERGWDCFKEEP